MSHMPDVPDAVAALESQKAALLRKISQLDDFRAGSVTTTTGRCGNPRCHCHRPQDPGHGPNFRLTYKEKGKTVTESFASPAARESSSNPGVTQQLDLDPGITGTIPERHLRVRCSAPRSAFAEADAHRVGSSASVAASRIACSPLG